MILGASRQYITVPTRDVLASGISFGSRGDEQERIRTGVDAVCERNDNISISISISAKVAGNHDHVSWPTADRWQGRCRAMVRPGWSIGPAVHITA